MITFPKAKINIGLRVTGKRSDGFHDIETLFYPVGLCDALEFVVPTVKVDEDELTVTGIDIRTRHDKNLVIRAVRKLREKYHIPFLRIHLHKVIPSGAGLGGGSSDAACIIRSINRCFDLSISEEEMRRYALELGSDCPFFIDPVPSIATGRGEELIPVTPFLKGLNLVMINPGIHISTRDAYMNSTPSVPGNSIKQLITGDPADWKKKIKNDFEDYVFKLYPQIREIKKSLYLAGAVYSSMSGSGSTVYGIFDHKPEIEEKLKEYVIWEGLL
ncbi:MAG: 4-(cytidine 5'-diphospho)-2-C-methyl-D-erythritol kinase [Bacteroidales bacterium]|jgi:4-diphosphocytidyl-2-C-methyl-D-erythritol kinase|nr:4-(cytidine 5'-diphospho)-2-C-methyl-D-erythritol kinase [Bacteroidales bacterium]